MPTVKKWMYWPVDSPVITQKWGARPEYYSQFGLPHHEGLDLRAPTGSKVYACADGIVSEVGYRRAHHPYGYAVRLVHDRPDGKYETLYAHLKEGSAKVRKGQKVVAGQLIALADNTGNSSAAHLHINAKKFPINKKNPRPPEGMTPLDYLYLSNGELLCNPLLLMYSPEETKKFKNATKSKLESPSSRKIRKQFDKP